jgi:DNA invertase Pin-like site-specific DNA recombinase
LAFKLGVYLSVFQEADRIESNMKKGAVIYARVSSEGDRQNTDRQVADLTSYAASSGLELIRIFEEKASGARDDRPVLAECLEWCCVGNASVLLVSELSRLGRTVKIITETVERLTKAGVNIHILDINLDTLSADGKENPMADVLVTVLGLGAQIERKQILGRLNSGRKNAIEKGVRMGRKPGYRKSKEQKEEQYAKAIKLLRSGQSVRNTAKLCDISPGTALRLKKDFLLKKEDQNKE